jgi:hypothetical protein
MLLVGVCFWRALRHTGRICPGVVKGILFPPPDGLAMPVIRRLAERIFAIREKNIVQLLPADASDDESALELVAEDESFLQKDMDEALDEARQ